VLNAFIVAAEVAFWLTLFAGLVTRYVLRRPRLGMALLVATPLEAAINASPRSG
jgi:hypothetical protein